MFLSLHKKDCIVCKVTIQNICINPSFRIEGVIDKVTNEIQIYMTIHFQ